MAPETPIPQAGPPLDCEEWIALLTDALDGTLPASDGKAFAAHKETCLACAQLLEEAQRGTAWLGYLRREPEVPSDLVDKILARTASAAALPAVPLPAGGAVALPAQAAWFRMPFALIERHAAESRLLMTVAMAFFSIAFTLDLAGVRLTQLRLSDLRPSALVSTVGRSYYTTSARFVRYYESLRFVYEVESRVNQIRKESGMSAEPERGRSVHTRPPAQANPPAQNNPPAGRSASPSGGAAQSPAADEPLHPRPLHLRPLPPQTGRPAPSEKGGRSATDPGEAIPVFFHPRGSRSEKRPHPAAHSHAPYTYERDQAGRSLA